MDPTLQNQQQIKPDTKKFIQSTSFCQYFINYLLKNTFEGVGLQNAKRMAPKNTHNQTLYTLQSFVKLGFTQKFHNHQLLTDEKDFKPPSIDTLAVQEIDTQKIQRALTDNPLASIQSASTTKSRLKTKKSDAQKSFRQRKFTQISEEIPETKSRVMSNFEKLPQVPNPFDYSEDPEVNKIRNNFLKIEKENMERKKQLQALQQKGQIDKQRNSKMARDMKKITYDYEGKIVGQGNGITQQSKILIPNNKFGVLKKLKDASLSKIDPTLIETTRKKDLKADRKEIKQAPMFRQKAQSIIQLIENDKGIAAGVKIVEELGKNKSVTKQNPFKKPSVNSLVDFKNSTKLNKFKEYHPITLNKSSLNVTNSYINNQQATQRSILEKQSLRRGSFINNKEVKSKSSYSLNDSKIKGIEMLQQSQSNRFEHSILQSIDERISAQKQKLKYKGLPFIKTKGYKAVDIESQMSFKYVLDQFDKSNNRSRLRNKIHINDISLLKHTLEGI